MPKSHKSEMAALEREAQSSEKKAAKYASVDPEIASMLKQDAATYRKISKLIGRGNYSAAVSLYDKLESAVSAPIKKPMVVIRAAARDSDIDSAIVAAQDALDKGNWKKAKRELDRARDGAIEGGEKYLKRIESKLERLGKKVQKAEDQSTQRKRDAKSKAVPRKLAKAEVTEVRKERGLDASTLKTWAESPPAME